MMYLLDNHFELTRQELINFILDYFQDYDYSINISKIPFVLPQCSLQYNIKKSPCKIAKALGFNVIALQ